MSATDFKDHFSTASDAYRRYRPHYPAELFAWLADLAPARDLAWDCATGTGQAARSLAQHFTKVIASDASAQQISQAQRTANIEYVVAGAETLQLEADSVDLITVAQALHWFDQTAFYANAWRSLKPLGVLAVWKYDLAMIEPAVDAVVKWYYHDVVGPYWPPERILIEKGYPPLLPPFTSLAVKPFAMQASWSRDDLLGYLGTWSASKYFQQATQQNPLALIEEKLMAVWEKAGEHKNVHWPLQLRIGCKHD